MGGGDYEGCKESLAKALEASGCYCDDDSPERDCMNCIADVYMMTAGARIATLQRKLKEAEQKVADAEWWFGSIHPFRISERRGTWWLQNTHTESATTHTSCASAIRAAREGKEAELKEAEQKVADAEWWLELTHGEAGRLARKFLKLEWPWALLRAARESQREG